MLTAKLFQPESGSAPISYLTLSHRWGKQNLLTLTTRNFQELGREIPLRSLSQTFRDAIDLTQRLGIGYLWIDSLCIIQDSPEDWRSESGRMGDVYKFAYCNLSATRASSGRYDGLFVNRERFLCKPLLLNLTTRSTRFPRARVKTQPYCVHRGFDEWTAITNADLNKRAWVLQERIMSPRTLHFCRNQIVFECSVAQCSERWPRPSLPIDFLETNDCRDYPLKFAWASINSGINSARPMVVVVPNDESIGSTDALSSVSIWWHHF